MKKVLLTFSLLVCVIAAKALTATIYVKADAAPFMYGWFTVSGSETKINGAWPGKQLTQSTTKTNKQGQSITFWYQTVEISGSSFNIIFNNGNTGNMKQTGNISNISSDRYFTYDGATGYSDITDQFGVEIPDVEIQSVALVSELNEWDGMAQLFQEIQKDKKYQFLLELTDAQIDQIEAYYSFKFLVNSSAYFGWDNTSSGLTLDTNNNWIEENLAASGNFGIDLDLAGTKKLLFTVTFAGGKDIYQGWTLRVEDGTGYTYPEPSDPEPPVVDAISTLRVDKQSKRYNVAGQVVGSGFRGLTIQDGRKYLSK